MNNKAEYEWVFKLIGKRKDFLEGKDLELADLFRLCDSDSQRELIASLLDRFFYLDGQRYGRLLRDMAQYIKQLNYKAEEMAIIAFVEKEEIDSSLEVLQCLKVPLAMEFDPSPKINPHFNSISNLYKQGIRHFVAVDEFMGTGVTVKNRYENFLKKNLPDATINFCVLTGMESAVGMLTAKGVPVKVFKILRKGISDYYEGTALVQSSSDMKALESKLADQINKTNLAKHSFGFLKSESLYYKENGNIPNNVFPIFWWKKLKNQTNRRTLFTRVQNGY